MNAGASPRLAPHLVAELTMHLRKTGYILSVDKAAALAIRAWIAANTAPLPAAAGAAPPRGYQWKTLFLPEGTELRMSTRNGDHHAHVVGYQILYQGRSVSPRGMTLAVCGDGRNAWRDLYIKFPGQRFGTPASRCRRENAQAAALPVANPADQLSCASIAMSEALNSMLALIERLGARSAPAEERRLGTARRGADILADYCAFD